MERIDVNTEHISAIRIFDKYNDDFRHTIYPKNTIKKISWIERFFGVNDDKVKANEKETIIEVDYLEYWATESDFLKGNPTNQIIDGVVYIKPYVLIKLMSGGSIMVYFQTYSECITFMDWLEKQSGYINLTDFEIKNNAIIRYYNF